MSTLTDGHAAPTCEPNLLELIAADYVRAAATDSGARNRARAAARFRARFGSMGGWLEASAGGRIAVAVQDRAYAAHAAVMS